MNLRHYLKYMMLRVFFFQFIVFIVAMLAIQHQFDAIAEILINTQHQELLALEKSSWSLQWVIGFVFIISMTLLLRNWKKSLETYILPLEEVENVIQDYRAGNKLRRYDIYRKDSDFITIGRMLNRILDEK